MSIRKCKEIERLVQKAQTSIDASKRDANNLLESTLKFRKELAFSSYDVHNIAALEIRTTADSTERFVAREDIAPGKLLFAELPKLSYPNFLITSLEDYTYKPVDIRTGITPKNWVCICCMKPVGHIVPVWCTHCGLPLCHTCGVPGKHRLIDDICNLGRRGSDGRFFGIGDMYLDVALTRFLLLEAKCEVFSSEIDRMANDTRVQKVISMLETNEIGRKLTESKIPFAFEAAKDAKESVRRACAMLVTHGNGFYPRHEVGIFHPIFGMFTYTCYPNIEVFANGDGEAFEIRAINFIPKGEFLVLDFLQQQLLPTIYRHSFLNSRWGIACSCARCADPTEFGTFIGSISCKCRRGYLCPDFGKSMEIKEENIICNCISPNNDASHSCRNKCSLSVIKQRDIVVTRMVKKINKNQSLTPLMKYNEFEKLRELTKSICGFHDWYFLTQILNGHMSSPTAQFVKVVSPKPFPREFAEFLKKGKHLDPNPEIEKRFTNLDVLILLAERLTPKNSRHNGYMLYYKAQLEVALMTMCRDRGLKTVFDWCVNKVLRVIPKLIHAWIRFIETKSKTDMVVMSKIARVFITDPLEDQMRRITAYLMKKTSSGQGHLIWKALADVYGHKIIRPQQRAKSDRSISATSRRNQLKGSTSAGTLECNRLKDKSPIRKSHSRDEFPHRKSEDVKYDKKAVTEDLLSSFSGVTDENFYADLFEPLCVLDPRPSPQSKKSKTNKLKEALIRQEEEERLLHKQKIRKQLRLLCTGSETEIDAAGATASESSLQSPKRREKFGRSVSAGPPIEGEGEDILENWGGLDSYSCTETEDDEVEIVQKDSKHAGKRIKSTKSHLMVNPIPIHHSNPNHRHRQRHKQQRHQFQKRYRHNGVDLPYVSHQSRHNSNVGKFQLIKVVEDKFHEEAPQGCRESQEQNSFSSSQLRHLEQSMLMHNLNQPMQSRYTALKYLCGTPSPPKYYNQRKSRPFHYLGAGQGLHDNHDYGFNPEEREPWPQQRFQPLMHHLNHFYPNFLIHHQQQSSYTNLHSRLGRSQQQQSSAQQESGYSLSLEQAVKKS